MKEAHSQYKTLIQLIDTSSSISEMEKIFFIEYIYHNPSEIPHYIKILQRQEERLQPIKDNFCHKYNALTSNLIHNLTV